MSKECLKHGCKAEQYFRVSRKRRIANEKIHGNL